MKRIVLSLAIIGFVSGCLFSQSVCMKIGVFAPRLESDLWQINMENLTFGKSDLTAVYYSGEFEYYFNRSASVSVEIGSYSKSVFAQYRDYEFDDGSPIYQDISLRIVPVEATLKYYPTGHRHSLNPFIGAGAGVYAYTYQQSGSFINFEDGSVTDGMAETRRFAFGLNGRAGLAFRFQSRLAILLEGKYQYVKGSLSEYFEGFESLDLSGFAVNAGIQFFF